MNHCILLEYLLPGSCLGTAVQGICIIIWGCHESLGRSQSFRDLLGYKIRFSTDSYPIEAYGSSFLTIRNPDSPSQDIVAGGVIERCEFSTCLVEMEVDLSCDRQSVRRNAVRGFWYDAISCLCDLIATNQKDASLRRMRAALLKQVGLNGVAEWDLKSAPPEK
jgi:uncharacterized protein DUF928